jgi:hypothetical protein
MEKSNHVYITAGIYGYCKMLLMYSVEGIMTAVLESNVFFDMGVDKLCLHNERNVYGKEIKNVQ